MNKRAEFSIQTYLIGVLLFMAIVVSLGGVAYTMTSTYSSMSGVSMDSSFTNTYDKLDTITGHVSDVQSEFEQADTGDQDASSQFYGGALGTLKTIIPSLSLTQTILEDISDSIGIDPFWIAIIGTIISIMLFTTFLYMIFGNRG